MRACSQGPLHRHCHGDRHEPPIGERPGHRDRHDVQGDWVGTYGADGYVLAAWNGTSGDLAALPAGVELHPRAGDPLRLDDLHRRPTCAPSRVRTESERRARTWYDATQVRVRLNFTAAYTARSISMPSTGTRPLVARTSRSTTGPAPADAQPDDRLQPRGLAPLPGHVPAGGSVLITVDKTAGTLNGVLSRHLPRRSRDTPPPTAAAAASARRPTSPGSRATGSARTAPTATSWSPGTGRAATWPPCRPVSATPSSRGPATAGRPPPTTDVRALESPDRVRAPGDDLVRRHPDPGPPQLHRRLQRHPPPLRRRLGHDGRARTSRSTTGPAPNGQPHDRLQRRRLAPLPDHRPGGWLRADQRRQVGGLNAVLYGLFLGGAGTPPPPPLPPPPPTTDIPGVQGTWVGTYGVDGYVLGAWNAGTRTWQPAGRCDLQPRAGVPLQLDDLRRRPTCAPSRVRTRPSAGRRPGMTRHRSGSASTSPPHTAARSISMPSTGTRSVARERHGQRRDRPSNGRPHVRLQHRGLDPRPDHRRCGWLGADHRRQHLEHPQRGPQRPLPWGSRHGNRARRADAHDGDAGQRRRSPWPGPRRPPTAAAPSPATPRPPPRAARPARRRPSAARSAA